VRGKDKQRQLPSITRKAPISKTTFTILLRHLLRAVLQGVCMNERGPTLTHSQNVYGNLLICIETSLVWVPIRTEPPSHERGLSRASVRFHTNRPFPTQILSVQWLTLQNRSREGPVNVLPLYKQAMAEVDISAIALAMYTTYASFYSKVDNSFMWR